MNTKMIRPTRLRCEYRENPLGIDKEAPRFCWQLESPERDQVQEAYRILVSEGMNALAAKRGTMWDSGRVDSTETLHVPYAGKPLQSRTRYWWKVIAWGKCGEFASTPATFQMGLLQAVPASNVDQVSESGKPLAATTGIHAVSAPGDGVRITVGSGSYHFQATGVPL